jgi:DedD protein
MRTVFEEEEELAPNGPRQKRGEDYDPDQAPDRELTISSTTLLAIFFGLVLICGLFFGFGYTLGRRSNSETSQLPAAPVSDLQPTTSASKPSAASQPASTATLPAADPQASDTSANPAADSEPQEDSSQAKTPETPANPAPQIVRPALPLLAQSPAPAPQTVAAALAGIMVQIAAISNPADADVLVGALQKRGYSVTARHSPGDALIHVQVGPFSNRADAIAMRQKLLGDGYNAILK